MSSSSRRPRRRLGSALSSVCGAGRLSGRPQKPQTGARTERACRQAKSCSGVLGVTLFTSTTCKAARAGVMRHPAGRRDARRSRRAFRASSSRHMRHASSSPCGAQVGASRPSSAAAQAHLDGVRQGRLAAVSHAAALRGRWAQALRKASGGSLAGTATEAVPAAACCRPQRAFQVGGRLQRERRAAHGGSASHAVALRSLAHTCS